MANVQSKENMTIAIREYTDGQGQQKKVWKTIGELITWDDGSKSFELWGPTGSTKGNVFAKDDNNQGGQQQGGYNNAPQQGGYQQAPQQPMQQPQNPQQAQANSYQQAQAGYAQQQAPKVNPQEPIMDFDDSIPF